MENSVLLRRIMAQNPIKVLVALSNDDDHCLWLLLNQCVWYHPKLMYGFNSAESVKQNYCSMKSEDVWKNKLLWHEYCWPDAGKSISCIFYNA